MKKDGQGGGRQAQKDAPPSREGGGQDKKDGPPSREGGRQDKKDGPPSREGGRQDEKDAPPSREGGEQEQEDGGDEIPCPVKDQIKETTKMKALINRINLTNLSRRLYVTKEEAEKETGQWRWSCN